MREAEPREERPEGWHARRSYLMRHTADVLFNRAQWFELQGCTAGAFARLEPQRLEIDLGFLVEEEDEHGEPFHDRVERRVSVILAPPRLVLFEVQPALEERPRPHGHPPHLLESGFLIQDVYFPEGASVTLEDQLRLNMVLRYWGRPWDDHEKSDPDDDNKNDDHQGYEAATEAIRRSRLALRWGAPPENKHPSDPYWDMWGDLLRIPIESDRGRVMALFPLGRETCSCHRACRTDCHPCSSVNWSDQACRWVRGESDGGSPGTQDSWLLQTDPRSFVWTTALLEKRERERLSWAHRQRNGPDGAESLVGSGHWVKLVNVDSSASARCGYERMTRTVGTTAFEREWIRNCSYLRWAEYGSYYGFSEHAGAFLSEACETPPAWRSFRESQFDQCLLLLYLRQTTIRFSDRLTALSSLARSLESGPNCSDRQADLRSEFRELRRQFALFTNLYQYPLISGQQQGIEMYTRQRERLGIEHFFEEVQAEVHVFDEFLAGELQEVSSGDSRDLAIVATLFLPITVVVGVLALREVLTEENLRWDHPWLAVGVLLATPLFYWATVLCMPGLKRWHAKTVERAESLFREFFGR